MNVEYVDLVYYLAIATEVTGLDVSVLSRVAKLNLADSALHAPAAGFGDTDLYPEFAEKAAVLVTRLTKNHPLPDGNKRCAWVALRLFVEINDYSWEPYPSVDDAEAAVFEGKQRARAPKRRIRPEAKAPDSWIAQPSWSDANRALYMDGVRPQSAKVQALPQVKQAKALVF